MTIGPTIASMLGGLALFLFGMRAMTDGVRQAAGEGIHGLLRAASRTRTTGFGLGTLAGSLFHSSAATVMAVGFVDAGLLELARAIPFVVGANLGTTLSMQALSLDLGALCFAALGIGLVVEWLGGRTRTGQVGRALFGFGLLLLGMEVMGDAIAPHREWLAGFLSMDDGQTWMGFLGGLFAWTALTMLWQSSGATIAISFALIQAGTITSLEQVYPILLGAHLGTCITAAIASLGTSVEARRVAAAHLAYNLVDVALGILCYPLLLWLVEGSSTDVVRQTANLNTLLRIVAALAVLPGVALLVRILEWTIRGNGAAHERSHLTRDLVVTPERALVAAIAELQRVSLLCRSSLDRLAPVILFHADSPKSRRVIRRNEQVVNEVKGELRKFLLTLARRRLSRRQSLLLQRIDMCMNDLERISDHIDKAASLAQTRRREPGALVDRDSLDQLFDLYERAMGVLGSLTEALDPEHDDFNAPAHRVLAERDSYIEHSLALQRSCADRIASGEVAPVAGLYYLQLVSLLDRLVRHARSIAFVLEQPEFRIKEHKMDRTAARRGTRQRREPIDPEEFHRDRQELTN